MIVVSWAGTVVTVVEPAAAGLAGACGRDPPGASAQRLLEQRVMDGNGHPEAVPAGTDVIVMPAQVGDADASEIAAAVLAALIGDIGIVVADFTGTQFCDPAGIQSLLGAARLADANRITLRLVAFGVVAVVFGQAGVDQVLPVYPTLREALTASPPP